MTRLEKQLGNKIQVIKWEKNTPVTQEEAEARLHQEGYQSFCWYDVPGVTYPRHKHPFDECLWILRGEMHFTCYLSTEVTHTLKSGDRIYFSAQTPHTVEIPKESGVSFLVGQKRV